jgi:hypothetical protein
MSTLLASLPDSTLLKAKGVLAPEEQGKLFNAEFKKNRRQGLRGETKRTA